MGMSDSELVGGGIRVEEEKGERRKGYKLYIIPKTFYSFLFMSSTPTPPRTNSESPPRPSCIRSLMQRELLRPRRLG
jgi:hypothetical protein